MPRALWVGAAESAVDSATGDRGIPESAKPSAGIPPTSAHASATAKTTPGPALRARTPRTNLRGGVSVASLRWIVAGRQLRRLPRRKLERGAVAERRPLGNLLRRVSGRHPAGEVDRRPEEEQRDEREGEHGGPQVVRAEPEERASARAAPTAGHHEDERRRRRF